MKSPIICPTITAYDPDEYRTQIHKVAKFAQRIQIDLTDGQFAPSQTIEPGEAWWPAGIKADFHLMYKKPELAVENILSHRPNLIIIHAEAAGDFAELAAYVRKRHVKIGVALLPATSPHAIVPALDMIDHVLIFSGNLGYQGGGHANTSLLGKVHFLKHHKPHLEIGWDGGINNQNISQLAFGGIDVFNVGGYIQKAADPEKAYNSLKRIVEETGTT